MNILVINCGSSSLKFQLIDAENEELTARGLCERIGISGSRMTLFGGSGERVVREVSMPDHRAAIRLVLDALTDEKTGVLQNLGQIGAVGHRVVHGGEAFTQATVITPAVKDAIRACGELAPLHNPANLTGVEACEALMPGVPMVAVFDTAFHQTMPEEAYLYAIPYRYYEKHKIRRYGFHGTSHDYVSHRAAALLGRSYEELKIIVCHLGNGASVSAVCRGRCVDTSMGMTPLEGLIMGTRSGDLDPAVIQFIAEKEGKSIGEIMDILNKESGVLGISGGLSSDFRDLENGSAQGERALRAFALRTAKYIGAYAAVMNGVDAVCFTAGVGENSASVRSMICGPYLGYLGITLDEQANQKRGCETVITTPESLTKVLVIPTNEELAIARQTYALVRQA